MASKPDRRLPPQVYQMTPEQAVQWGMDNYGLTELDPAQGRESIISALQDAKQRTAALPASPAPPAAPAESPAPPQLQRAAENEARIEPAEGRESPHEASASTPQVGPGNHARGPRVEDEAPQREVGPSAADHRARADSDPVQDQRSFEAQHVQRDIPEPYTLPEEDRRAMAMEAQDPFASRREEMEQQGIRNGPVNLPFRHPAGTRWLYHPINETWMKPTEKLMQRRDLVPILQGDPPPGAAIITA